MFFFRWDTTDLDNSDHPRQNNRYNDFDEDDFSDCGSDGDFVNDGDGTIDYSIVPRENKDDIEEPAGEEIEELNLEVEVKGREAVLHLP